MVDSGTILALVVAVAFVAVASYGQRQARRSVSEEARRDARIGVWTAWLLAIWMLISAFRLP